MGSGEHLWHPRASSHDVTTTTNAPCHHQPFSECERWPIHRTHAVSHLFWQGGWWEEGWCCLALWCWSSAPWEASGEQRRV